MDQSETVQNFARQFVDGERFATPTEVLMFSLSLLSAFEEHYHDQLGQNIATVLAKMEAGNSTAIDTKAELKTVFADFIEAGKRQLS